MRQGRTIALVTGLAVAAGVGAAVALGGPRAAYHSVRYPADETAFGEYVTEHVGQDYFDSSRPDEGPRDRAWALSHPEEVLAAGRASCDWLRTQPRPGRTDPSGGSTVSAVLTRYAATPADPGLGLSESGRSVVVAAAWEHLCRAERARRTAPRGTGND